MSAVGVNGVAVAMMYPILSLVLAILPGESAYLDAVSAEHAEQYQVAAEQFLRCADEDPNLAPYAQIRAARNLAMLGKRKDAVDLLNPLITDHTGPWSRLALYERGNLRLEAGQVGGAADIEAALNVESKLWWLDTYRREAYETFLSHAEIRPDGQSYFRQVIDESRYIVPRLDAARLLAGSDDPNDRLAAALGFVRTRRYRDAQSTARALNVDQFSSDDARARWHYVQGAIDWSNGRHSRGREKLLSIVEQYPASPIAPTALQYLVRLEAVNKRFERAEATLSQMNQVYGTTTETGNAQLDLGVRYLRAGKIDAGRAHLEDVAETHANTSLARNALMRLGDGLREDQRWDDALAAYDRVWKFDYKGADSFEAAYKYGETAKVTSKPELAAATYRAAGQIGVGYYYGHRARAISDAQSGGAARAYIRHTIPDNLVTTIPREPVPIGPAPEHDVRLDRLNFFSIYGLPEAEWEMADMLEELKESVNPRYFRAIGESGNAYSAMQVAAEIKFGESPNGLQTTERLRIRYPRAYWAYVRALGDEIGVDPYLILSVARQESTYRPALESWAGAIGVMQLMPATANWLVGADDRIERKHVQALTQPVNSLRLGAVYLSRMLERYDGNLVYALAAYNAGPGNCDKWVRRNGQLPPSEFVEAIAFDETRNYVKRVLANYMTYYSIYDSPARNAS